jgi:Transposase DDE domain
MSKKKRNPDHVRRRNRPSENDEVIEKQFKELLSPAVFRQEAYYRSLGLRSRILNLSLMVASVLTLIWRQVPSVRELTRMLNRDDLLWCKAVDVSQQAVSERLLVFPAVLFEKVYKALVPLLIDRWAQRKRRPLPPAIEAAQAHFDHIWAADGSTLEALFRKLEALKEVKTGQLAGKMCLVIDLVRQLPQELWFSEEPMAYDTNFTQNLLALAGKKNLLILDRGFYDFTFFARLVDQGSHLITRLKTNAAIETVRMLTQTDTVRDSLIRLGTGQNGAPILTMRLIEVRVGRSWHRYVTSVLAPEVLPPFVVADLYCRRWRIEDAFHTAKRLLGLSYLWTGSVNGIQLQIWATWLFYAVLVDLGDAVADAIALPFDRISLEMLFRAIYHFTQAHHKGKATDPIAYFAAPQNKDLGIVKQKRKRLPKLDLRPYPI